MVSARPEINRPFSDKKILYKMEFRTRKKLNLDKLFLSTITPIGLLECFGQIYKSMSYHKQELEMLGTPYKPQ